MKSFDLGKSVVLGAAAASLLAPQAAQAGGLYAGDPGSQAQSRAGAFVAKADDATALMHNPAGLANVRGWEIFAGANFVHFTQTFDRDGVYQHWVDGPPSEPAFEGAEMPGIENDGAIQPIPFLAGAARFGKLAIALGVFAPQGAPNRDYPETVDVNGVAAPNPGRYDIIKQESLAALPSLAVAYRITDKLDVGVRGSWGFGTLKARTYLWALENHQEDFEKDAVFDVDVEDMFVPAFGAGLHFRPTDSLEIGASYSSEMVLDMKGKGSTVLGSRSGETLEMPVIGPVLDNEAKCAPGGTDASNLKACVKVIVPMTATAGARYVFRDGKGAEKADIELDVRWENHAAAKDITVTVDAAVITPAFKYLNETVLFHGFEDVISVRLGGAYALAVGDDTLVLRAGTSYDTAAAPDSWSRLDIDGSSRLQFAGGAAYDGGSWRVDLGGSAILSPERTVTGPDPFTPPPPPGPPQTEREHPDPSNPSNGPSNQIFHPINLGTFTSGYVIIATGVTFKF